MANVRILLATYNGSKYIREMIDSIVVQDHQDWQLILSDDGSTDTTARILEEYAEKMPDRIIHYQSGMRFGNAQNHFMHLLKTFSDAPYIMFCDQDDIWHKDKISKTLAKMEEVERPNVPALVHTDLCVVDGERNVMDPSFMHFSKLVGARIKLHELLVQNVVTGCTVMVNSTLAAMATERIPETGIIMHDWWLVLIAAAAGTVGFLNEATIDYRQHGSNAVGAKNTRSAAYILKRIKENKIRSAIFDTFDQAEALYHCFSEKLTEDAKKKICDYMQLKKKNAVARKYTYLRRGYLKCGLSRVAGQIIWG